MNWITKLERKYGRFCIPNLINILIGGQILVYAIELFVNQYISFYLSLSRSALFAGQIWRLFTFVLVPFSGALFQNQLPILLIWKATLPFRPPLFHRLYILYNFLKLLILVDAS